MIGVQDQARVAATPTSLPAALVALAAHRPDAVALREKHLGLWREYTRQEYLDHTMALARGLAELGVEVGDRVAIVSDSRAEWFFADLAIQGLGAQTVGIDPGASVDTVQERLSSTACSVVLVEDEEQYDKVMAGRVALPGLRTIVVIDDRGIPDTDDPAVMRLAQLLARDDQRPFEWPRPVKDAATTVAAMVEVGSGPSSAVRVMHQGDLAALAEAARPTLETLGPNDNVLAHLPLAHVAERTVSLVGALRWGYIVNIATEPDLLLPELREVQPTVLVTTAAVWHFLGGAFQARLSGASRFKRWLGKRCLERGHLLGPIGTVLWYRPARRQMGLAHIRHSVCVGPAPDSEVAALFEALGLPIVTTDFVGADSAIGGHP